ncbi:unnamed protein product [Darwinula stevensoni]|uniref:Uncharacterized protein n=1 Tax=Darwinula stevensoni TaxID=69355 RepID=A0A7R9AFI1_9CRUS|nr:unnamed protein product [Darwinula stevensoni]CAG0903340.1 unnamed protein product [Darwinula stevensoni]
MRQVTGFRGHQGLKYVQKIAEKYLTAARKLARLEEVKAELVQSFIVPEKRKENPCHARILEDITADVLRRRKK